MRYRNAGAPFRRDNGEVWQRGAVHEPTANELGRRRYKLRAAEFEPETPAPTVVPAGEAERLAGWPLPMAPSLYLELHPQGGEHTALARELTSSDEQDAQEEEPLDGVANE
jgi:hypothetical protein